MFYSKSFDLRKINVLLALTLSALLLFAFGFAAKAYAAPSISADVTTENHTGNPDQDIDIQTTTANVPETKASRTLTVGATPAAGETITIGSCVVSFVNVPGETEDDTDCTGGASIDVTSGGEDDPRTAAGVAGALRSLSNISDPEHGELDISGSSTNAIFTTAGVETSATAIAFTDGTSGDITSTASTSGIIPVAQVNALTITGTVQVGDTYELDLPDAGIVSYTVQPGDEDHEDIIDGLLGEIDDTNEPFTATKDGASIVFTARVAGDGFTLDSDTADAGSIAQVVEFAVLDVEAEYEFTIILDGISYSYTAVDGDDEESVALELLDAGLDSNPDVSCVSLGSGVIECEADSDGVPFTFSVSVTGGPAPAPISGYSTVSGQSAPTTVAQAIANIQSWIQSLVSQLVAMGGTPPPGLDNLTVPVIPTDTPAIDLTLGATGAAVTALQNLLIAQGQSIPSGATGYFGPETRSALAAYQTANGISPAAGYFGTVTRLQMKSAGLTGLWW